MTQIEELQARIARALDRISQGVEGLSVPQPVPVAEPAAPATDSDEIARLHEALAEERMANAQLEERVRLLHARGSEPEAGAEPDAALLEQLAAQRAAFAELDAEMQRLRLSNDMLRKTNQEMREALEANLGEPHLINQAMLAELEALRATRAAETAEARAVLGALEPLLAEAEAAPQGEGAMG